MYRPPYVDAWISGDHCEILYLEYRATRLNHDILYRGTIMKADLLSSRFHVPASQRDCQNENAKSNHKVRRDL